MSDDNICEYVFGHMRTLLGAMNSIGTTQGDSTFTPGKNICLNRLDDSVPLLGHSAPAGSSYNAVLFMMGIFLLFMVMSFFTGSAQSGVSQKNIPHDEHYRGDRDGDFLR